MRIAPFLALIPALVLAQEPVELGVVDRIKTEAFDHSKVMDHLYNLTEVYGPRLTGSPGFDEAANWTSSRLKEFGLENVHFEKWGPFGRAWSLKQSSLELIEPRFSQLDAIPLAWSAPTNGPATADLVRARLARCRQELAWFRLPRISSPKKDSYAA
jgi:carboxypeptidase Q